MRALRFSDADWAGEDLSDSGFTVWLVSVSDRLRGELKIFGGKTAVDLPELIMSFTFLWPNTALEPTAFTLSGSRCGVRFADAFRGRGSALGR